MIKKLDAKQVDEHLCPLVSVITNTTKQAHMSIKTKEAADGASPSAADPLSQTEDWLLGTCAAASSPTRSD